MRPAQAASALRVQEHIGPAYQVLEFTEPTRTAADAAAAVGCSVAEIAKSLVFASGDALVLVIASGGNRVDEAKVAALIGAGIRRPDGRWVRDRTGFAIGGIPPVAHDTPPFMTLIDQDIMAFEGIWAAAGTPNAVFKLTPSQLVELTGGTVADVALAPAPPPITSP
jgi:prolyl-tRNA editing enzyme YbaK/EbsC (Cys-tRNA(Pro) deacylase)